MRNKYILIEMNQRNEIRANVNMTIKNMELMELEDINVKIDTGCPYTSIPILKLGISNVKAQQMKQKTSFSFGTKMGQDGGRGNQLD